MVPALPLGGQVGVTNLRRFDRRCFGKDDNPPRHERKKLNGGMGKFKLGRT